MQLAKRQHAIITGTLLGDGCLERNGNFVRLRLEHGISQKSYLFWKHKELKNITGSVMELHAYHKVNKCFYDSVRVYTHTDPVFEQYWTAFYQNKKKVIPSNIRTLLKDPLSVAVWFMDDGYKRNDCNALRLGTDSFTKNEQGVLRSVLKKNFKIDATLHKKGKYWNLYIPQKEAIRFVKLIKPFIIPELTYKITLTP
ncbi:MAG: homing endonuclease [Parcubacteria group bacterium Gr01-1014_17]|nr:MAG: homing endonuclease [Parcubacteria group bacterium Gr01-1014_17]